MTNERLLAYALIALGGVTLLAQLGGADWLWLGLISAAFLLGYSARQNYGFLVAGSILMGVAVGTLIGTQSGMLLSLAVGFFAIDRVEPKANRWPLYAAGIFAVLGGLSALSALGLLGSVGFALLLIALGAFLLLRKQPQTPSTPQETYRYTPPTQTTPIQTPSAQAAPAQAAPPADTAPSTPSAVSAATDSGSTLAGTPLTTAVREQSTPAAEPVTPDTDLKAAAAEATGAGDEALAARRHRLELWRRETASRDGTPAYIVFSNDTLTKIAEANPRSLEELGRVRGVGPVKLERYGPAVLELLDNP